MTQHKKAIGLDYDGTIADTSAMKVRWISERHGIDVEPWKCNRTACVPIIGVEAYETMVGVVYEREWTLQAPPVDGSLEALDALMQCFDVYLVTARTLPRVEFSREWLHDKGVGHIFAGMMSSLSSSKPELCALHDLVGLVDDDLRHLAPLTETSTEGVWFRPGAGEEAGADGVQLATSWSQVVNHLTAFA